ncbi:MAG: DoxX family protein [Crocinitomicaceae bacterium]
MNEMRLKNQKTDIAGRSLLINILSIVLNITALTLIVAGFHHSTTDSALALKISGILLLVITIAAMLILKGLYLFSYVARALVGGLFIVSGLIKANDPWGFAFKLQEYFSPSGLAYDYPFFEVFEPYTLQLSILICVVEIVLGAAVILGGKIKLASWALLVMMIFFTWLTYYTASCNESQQLAMETGEEFSRDCVTDCGCFGDALRGSVGRSLTPLESFWKDLTLFYFVLIIFINQWKVKLNTSKENWIMIPAAMVVVGFFSWVFGWMFPIFFALIALLGSFVFSTVSIGKLSRSWKMAIYVVLLSFSFSIYTAMYLPVKDYRAYAIGNDLEEQMNNGVAPEIEMQLLYKNLKSGEVESFAVDEWETYMDTTKYKYVDRKDVVLKSGKDPSIMDFRPSIEFEKLSEKDKKTPYIDSIVTADYEQYYVKMRTVESRYGTDTIWAVDYDSLIYPDSIYSVSAPYMAKTDPHASWEINMTPYLLDVERVFLMTIRDMSAYNESSIDDFKKILEGAKEQGIPFYVLSPATDDQIRTFKSKHDFEATFLTIDGTEIKIVIRSNPGLVLLENGVVRDKWPSRSIPDFDSIFEDYIKEK